MQENKLVVPRALSLSDLVLIDGFWEAYEEDDKDAIRRILYQNGLDVQHGWTTDTLKHRNVQGKIVKCTRFIGQERLDSRWIKSGAATTEAINASTGDASFVQELEHMGRQGFGGGMYESIAERYVKQGSKGIIE